LESDLAFDLDRGRCNDPSPWCIQQEVISDR
jgi:hypothetical protein